MKILKIKTRAIGILFLTLSYELKAEPLRCPYFEEFTITTSHKGKVSHYTPPEPWRPASGFTLSPIDHKPKLASRRLSIEDKHGQDALFCWYQLKDEENRRDWEIYAYQLKKKGTCSLTKDKDAFICPHQPASVTPER